MTTVVIGILVLAVALLLVLQFVVRPRLGRRGRLAVDAALGDRGAERAVRRRVSHDVVSRIAPGSHRPGGYLLHGKAAKAVAQLARTFLVRAEPAAVAAVVEPVVRNDGRFVPATGGLAPGEVAAWESPGPFGPFPRLSVRASPSVPGTTEFGVTDHVWALEFPQGGPLVDRLWEPALLALRAARLTVSEQTREFRPGPDVRTDLDDRDGRWHAAGLLPTGAPDLTKDG